MTYLNPISLTLALAFAVLTIFSGQANAAGGGGGASNAPSLSAPSFDPVEKYQEGVAHLRNKEYKKAEKAFKKVLSVARKDANTNYLLGLSYVGQDKMKKARKPLERAVKYDQDNAVARGYLGAVYASLGKHDKAIKQKNRLLTQLEECGECPDKTAINQSIERIVNETTANPQAGLIVPDAARGDTSYLAAIEEINRGEYRSALQTLKSSAQAFGPHPDVLTYQGFANRKLGNHTLALRYYRAALAVDAMHRGANEYLGEYYVETGDMKSARRQLAKLESICSFGCEEAEELRRWITADEA